MTTNGEGHPLPASDEARHDEIPEHLEHDKGRGDEAAAATQPEQVVAPDGEAYPADGPDAQDGNDRIAQEQAAYQDRGQSLAEQETVND